MPGTYANGDFDLVGFVVGVPSTLGRPVPVHEDQVLEAHQLVRA